MLPFVDKTPNTMANVSMKKKWLICLGVLNLVAILFAAANLLTDFAILAPKRLAYEVGDLKSVKNAIFQAESGGIEMMRRYALAAAVTLTIVMLINFVTFDFESRPCIKSVTLDGHAFRFIFNLSKSFCLLGKNRNRFPIYSSNIPRCLFDAHEAFARMAITEICNRHSDFS
jgi:hypothetical protein